MELSLDATRRLRHGPALSLGMLVVGLLVAGVAAPWQRDDLMLVRGGELILLALTRLALQGHYRWFFRGFLLTGIGLPLVGAAISPIYYSGGYRIGPMLEMGLIGALVGAGFLVLGILGTRRLAEDPGPEELDGAPAWVGWVETSCEGALWLMVVTLGAGEWSSAAVAAVGLGALALVAGLVTAFLHRSPFTRGEIGGGLAFAGLVTVVASVVIVVTSNGRATEAVIGIPPGVLVGFLGLGMLGGGPAGPPARRNHRVRVPDGEDFDVVVGEPCPGVDALLAEHGGIGWALLDGGEELVGLRGWLDRQGFPVFPVLPPGRGEDESCCLLVLGLHPDQALERARSVGAEKVLLGMKGDPVEELPVG